MKIGEIEREITVEPLEEPVPAKEAEPKPKPDPVPQPVSP